jgi:hypothetical protein
LTPIPRDVENAILLSYGLGNEWLRREDRTVLREYFRNGPRDNPEIRHSQFGGIPILVQGHRQIECPNPRCPTRRWGHPIVRNERYYQMKELAVIDQDSGFEMETHWAQVAFHICWGCHTIHGQYRID